MKLERRAAVVLGVVALVAVPAAVLRVLCVGRSCDQTKDAVRKVPFCSLPPNTRDAIAAGYREGRSPDVLGVTRAGVRVVSSSSDPAGASWPSMEEPSGRVPVIFWGRRIAPGAEVKEMGLDDVAPTLARLIDFDIPHPDVRSGRAVTGTASGPVPRLLVHIVLRGVDDIASDPVVDALAEDGAYGNAHVESLPRDPAALMTTIGTGGVPSQHGITGTLLRNDRARVAKAWMGAARARFGHGSPRSVIATLADDLDETLGQQPLIGLVADTPHARGLVGGNWYVDNDRDLLSVVPTRRVLHRLDELLSRGFGRDGVPDLLAVSLRTTRAQGATAALHVLRIVQEAVGSRFAAAVVALPSEPREALGFPASDVGRAVNDAIGHPVVEADTAGGFFLDQKALAAAGVTKDDVVDALEREVVERYGSKSDGLFADVFPGLSVEFARFC